MTNGSILGIRERFAAYLGFSHAGERDLYQSFGYPRYVRSEELYAMYRRNDIASRIIRAFSQATFREMPTICDGPQDEDASMQGPFIDAWEEMAERFDLQRMFERADRLSSIGRFGLLVFGFNDGQDISQPLRRGKHELLFLQPYTENNIVISEWDTDQSSPRFGLPIRFTVNTNNLEQEGGQRPSQSLRVHYSRCMHISEFLDEDPIYGTPRLLSVYNRLKDLEKVVGGSAETFWVTANRGLAFWADKDANLSDTEVERIKSDAEDFQNKLRRTLVGSGMTAQVLGSDVPPPRENVDTLLDLIAGAVGMPKRILIGSERGELSSSQDESNWAARIDERRNVYAAKCIVKPFIEFMVMTGNLPQPRDIVSAYWEESSSLTPIQEAELAERRTNALKNYVTSPGSDLVVTPDEFRQGFLGMDPMAPEDMLEEELFGEPEEEGMEDPVDEDEMEEEGEEDDDVSEEVSPARLRL